MYEQQISQANVRVRAQVGGGVLRVRKCVWCMFVRARVRVVYVCACANACDVCLCVHECVWCMCVRVLEERAVGRPVITITPRQALIELQVQDDNDTQPSQLTAFPSRQGPADTQAQSAPQVV